MSSILHNVNKSNKLDDKYGEYEENEIQHKLTISLHCGASERFRWRRLVFQLVSSTNNWKLKLVWLLSVCRELEVCTDKVEEVSVNMTIQIVLPYEIFQQLYNILWEWWHYLVLISFSRWAENWIDFTGIHIIHRKSNVKLCEHLSWSNERATTRKWKSIGNVTRQRKRYSSQTNFFLFTIFRKLAAM